MTFWDPRPTLANAQTTLANTGVFTAVQRGEPLSPPTIDPGKLLAALMWRGYVPISVPLGTTEDHWEFLVRIYASAGMNPADAQSVEDNVSYGFSQAVAALAGDFTLGGTVRAIDWAGEGGGHIAGKWGHVTIGGTIFRAVDLEVPVIVDPGTVMVP